MDISSIIELKRQPFWKRIDLLYDFQRDAKLKGDLMGRVGRPPVGPIQSYQDPMTGKFIEVLMFGSNSYLGLSNDPIIKEAVKKVIDQYGLGEGGSPAFSGYMEQQQELEKKLAELSGHNDAILTAGGYISNLAWISALVGRDDVIVYDKSSHASTLDAIKMTGIRHAYHFNTEKPDTLRISLEAAVKKYPDSQIFVSVEGVRSIDGSVADLKTFLSICRKYGDKVFFMLDDAHGLGTLGEHGHGTLEYLDLKGQVDLRMSTCSKALGIQGAFMTGDAKIMNYIRTIANPYTFTTALSQPVIAAISAGIDFMNSHPERLKQLHINKVYMQDNLEKMGFNIYKAPSGIIPIYISNAPCEKINRELFINGLFANVFSYPAVSPGMERIRLSIMATHTRDHLDKALEILRQVAKKYNII